MEKKDQWCCPECKSKRPKTGNLNTPVRPNPQNTQEDPDLNRKNEDHNVTHRKKTSRSSDETPGLEQISSPESCAQATAQKDLITELKVYMAGLINNQTDSLREAIAELTESIRKQNNRIEQLETRVQDLESQKSKLGDTTALESKILNLEVEIQERDRMLLLNDVEIAGYPEEANENGTQVVVTLAKKIGVDLDPKEVVSAERVGPPRSAQQGAARARPRPLAVRLTRRDTRDTLLKAARVRRGVTTEGLPVSRPACSVYINERLSKHYRQLFQQTREISRSKNFKYVWTRDGKIYARQDDGKARHRIQSEADLKRIFGEF
ncbi:uncharacterized protein LOC135086406 [Ostrinia nubilalis]|uniref:uncharacterized protein LOC135086406 n=1 Tax=Ostrinia nubilalis TaxID=29057 RepID=UPI003082645B